jgi:hypothetical protein
MSNNLGSSTLALTGVENHFQPGRNGSMGQARYTTGKSASTRSESQVNRYAKQNQAASLLPKEAVAGCMRRLQVFRGNSEELRGAVTVYHVPATESAHYGGLQTCGSVWHCPICAAKISEKRRQELHSAISQAKEKGLQVVMCTYTFRHDRADNLQDILDRFLKAFRASKAGRAAKSTRELYGVKGIIRALEVTYSDKNGWHPHIHELVFLDASSDVQAYGCEVRNIWENVAQRHGLDMNEHGFKLDNTDSRVAEYIAKFGKDPSDETVSRYTPGTDEWSNSWNETCELSKWHIKQGQKERQFNEHCTPFELLEYSRQGDEVAGFLFKCYAYAFKGRRQLYWSAGLKEFFGIKDKTDEELANEQEEKAVALVSLDAENWKIIVANDRRAQLLEAASYGDINRVLGFLDVFGVVAYSCEEQKQEAS